MSDLHAIRIVSPRGRGVLTKIELDGQELRGVTVVNFTVGIDGTATVTLRLYADVEIEGEAQIVKRWRRVRRPSKGLGEQP